MKANGRGRGPVVEDRKEREEATLVRRLLVLPAPPAVHGVEGRGAECPVDE